MQDILSILYHNDPYSCQVLCGLANPETPEEALVSRQLRTVPAEAAEALTLSISDMADAQAERSFYAGVHLGAQMMAQLLGELPGTV